MVSLKSASEALYNSLFFSINIFIFKLRIYPLCHWSCDISLFGIAFPRYSVEIECSLDMKNNKIKNIKKT